MLRRTPGSTCGLVFRAPRAQGALRLARSPQRRRGIPNERERRPSRKPLERQKNRRACRGLGVRKQLQVALQHGQVDDERRRIHTTKIELLTSPHYISLTCQGSPRTASSSRNGSGSSCSTLNTPRPRHCLVSIILAPTIAGTPVVYETACARTSFHDSS
jgi:hypothetical protein